MKIKTFQLIMLLIEIGLTGCLNFYRVSFNNTRITANDTACEDVVNIVDSQGSISELDIRRASSDALDIDASNIEIKKLYIDSAVNDCL